MESKKLSAIFVMQKLNFSVHQIQNNDLLHKLPFLHLSMSNLWPGLTKVTKFES